MARLGLTARLKINELPLDIIGDFTIEENYTEVEIKNRKSNEITYLRALYNSSFDITVENNKEDAALQALKAANKTGTPVTITITEEDGDTEIVVKEYIITKFSRSYPLEDKMAIDVSFKPSALPKTTP